MLSRDEYYERVDLAVYRQVVAPLLGKRVLDIHVHLKPRVSSGAKYQVKGRELKYKGREEQLFRTEHLLQTAGLLFPDQEFHALVFGSPRPEQYAEGNDYIAAECREHPNLFPLYIPDMRATEEQVRDRVRAGGFLGFKPYWTMVDWMEQEDDVTIMDMLPAPYLRVADDWGLMIMLHIPGRERLASQSNIECLQTISRQYPGAKIIVAHLGRSYCPWSIKGGIAPLCDLPNLYWDISFVQESSIFEILFDHVDPSRVMYGSDLPLAEVRGRRVCINDRWVDVSREQLGWTAHRDAEHPVEATFMAYEMIRAMAEGAEAAGLSVEELRPVFYENGMRLIETTRRSLEAAV